MVADRERCIQLLPNTNPDNVKTLPLAHYTPDPRLLRHDPKLLALAILQQVQHLQVA